MLSRVNRLLSDRDFIKVKTNGKVFQSDSFGLAYLQRNDSLPSRFGFVVSNKISKKATVRNKIKRELREAVRKITQEIKEEFDIIFLVKQKMTFLKKDEIEKEVGESLLKSGLMK